MIRDRAPPGDLLVAFPRLVSRRTGVVRTFQAVQKDICEPLRPYIFCSEIANHRFAEKVESSQRLCSGKGMCVGDARISALGEAVERYSGAVWDYREVLYARRGDLEGESLDPRRLVLYAPHQYTELPYAPYQDDSILGWVRARSLVTDQLVFVPALAVLMSYASQFPGEFLCPITSNGLAAGATLLDAILAASCEVLERDAFIITWMNRLPCRRIDPASHPDPEVLDLCEAYRRRGVEMQLYRLPTDHPCHVFAALGIQRKDIGPAVVVGLGADSTADRAARKAILEVAQVRPALRQRMRQPETQRRIAELVADPRRVANLDDHDLLYASPETRSAFDFLFAQPLTTPDWGMQRKTTAEEQVQRLSDHLRAQHSDLLYYNLTPRDMATFRLHTVRAILPDFQPIFFGANEARLGGDRLYEVPHQLGHTPARTTLEQLNPNPHPLA